MEGTSKHRGKVFSGSDFKKEFGTELFKVFNDEDCHRGYRYVDGPNEDPVPFNPSGTCTSGGFYFTVWSNIHRFISFGSGYRSVAVPDDALVYVEEYKFKSNKIVIELGSKKPFGYDVYLNSVTNNGFALKHVPEAMKTPELCKIAVTKDGFALQYVPEAMKTPELCEIAVTEDGSALEYVPEATKTPELCKIAVTNNGFALKHVPEAMKTPELCKIAVTKNGYVLEYVPEAAKTRELCKIAVTEDGKALKYVPEAMKTLLAD